MLFSIIKKDLQNVLLSPKFTAVFIVSSIMILLSIFIGIQEYEVSVRQYETGAALADQDLRERTSWMGASKRVLRRPDPMQIFASGISNDIGRVSMVDQLNSIKLKSSNYSNNPLFAVFRMIDLVFIVQIVFSLLAVLFTYNTVNGERENGMLRLVFSNSVPRYKYAAAKFIGSWLGLAVPLSIPMLLGILLILSFNIPMNGAHWIKLISILGMSLLYFTFFIALSLMVSTMTKKSASSFILLLVLWIIIVLIIPRSGTMAAGQIIHVPGTAEIESRKQGYAKGIWEKHDKELGERWRNRSEEMAGMSAAERENYRDDKTWGWMEEDENLRGLVQQEIFEYELKIDEDLRNRKLQQEKLGLLLARISPASSYQLAVMNLAEADIGLKNRYEKQLNDYRQTFTDFIRSKQAEDNNGGGIRITLDSERGLNISTPDLSNTIDVSSIPKFTAAGLSFSILFDKVLPDIGLLIIYSLLALFLSVLFFLKYDVR